jgi:alkaline phosphatase D
MRRAILLAAAVCLGACAPRLDSESPPSDRVPAAPAAAPPSEAAADSPPAAAQAGTPLPVRGDAPPLPSPDKVLTRIALGSCSEETRPLPIFAAVAAAKPDLFLWLGDNVYGDQRPTAGETPDPGLPKLRQAYEDLNLNAHFSAFNMSTPSLATWDDHDYGRNDAGADFAGRETAERMFETYWGPAALGGDHPGVYGARIFGPPGRRVQIILLDTRFFRSALKRGEPDAEGRRAYAPQADPAATMLGEAQWQWLEEELRRPAEVRLLASSIQVLSDNHPYEAWWTMPNEQRRLLETIRASGAKGVIALSGDRHVAALYRRRRGLTYPLHELTASSLNKPFVQDDSELASTQLGRVYTPVNFGMVEIDWARRTVGLSVRGLDGAAVRSLTVPFSELGHPVSSGRRRRS